MTELLSDEDINKLIKEAQLGGKIVTLKTMVKVVAKHIKDNYILTEKK